MNWPPLVTHRKRQKLLLSRRILLGGSIIPSSNFTPHPHPSPRLHHCMALLRPNMRTSAHLHSYFPSTVKLWNELSSELISVCTQATFKLWLLSFVFFYYLSLALYICPCCLIVLFLEDCLTSRCVLLVSPYALALNMFKEKKKRNSKMKNWQELLMMI